MDIIRIKLENHSILSITCDDGIAYELRDHFAFFVKGFKFMPAYKRGWDGKIRIFDIHKRTLPAGLYHELKKFCVDRDYEIILEKSKFGEPGQKTTINPQEIWDFLQSLKIHSKGKPIQVRDYQFNAICKAIEDQRILLLSPTGSGKSLIIYCLIRWFMKERLDKLLIIVPTTSLVEQMYSDFDDYSSHDMSFNVSQNCHRIFSGQEKTNIHERVFISTWQSIFRLPRTWFGQFGVIFGDEAHLFTANSLTKSMEKAGHAQYRIGCTGTLDDSATNHLILQGVFGHIQVVTTTRKLQDAGSLAGLDINMLELIYPPEICSSFKGVSYQQEIDWIVRSETRNRFIKNLALDCKGNTLIMFQFIQKHGKVLYEMIRQSVPEDRKVFFVAGETDKDDREAIRHIVETQKDAIIVGSMGVFSTGVNLKNLHNIIFGSPSKSKIKVLQSIGRTLRIADNGIDSTLFDLWDNLKSDKKINYAYLHGKERLKIYKEQEFKVKHHKVNMK